MAFPWRSGPVALRGFGSDDASFAARDIPTVGLFAGAGGTKSEAQAQRFGGTAGQPFDLCYHKACDTVANIDGQVLEQITDALTDALNELGYPLSCLAAWRFSGTEFSRAFLWKIGSTFEVQCAIAFSCVSPGPKAGRADACAGLRQGVAFHHGPGDIIFVLVVNHCRITRWQLTVPQSLSMGLNRETGWDGLDYELREQKAQTLGNLGGQVERALAALRGFDAAAHGTNWEDRRHAMLDEAADLVWAFMIQRELCGFRNWEAVVKDYEIPREVLNRVGQVRRKAG